LESTATSTATLYASEDGFFTITKPENWELRDNPMSKYKTIAGPVEYTMTPSVSFYVEEPQIAIGLNGLKLMGEFVVRNTNAEAIVICYLFPGRGTV
jgi:hypothetical protein